MCSNSSDDDESSVASSSDEVSTVIGLTGWGAGAWGPTPCCHAHPPAGFHLGSTFKLGNELNDLRHGRLSRDAWLLYVHLSAQGENLLHLHPCQGLSTAQPQLRRRSLYW